MHSFDNLESSITFWYRKENLCSHTLLSNTVKEKSLKLDVTLSYVINKLIHLNKFGDEDTKFILMFGNKIMFGLSFVLLQWILPIVARPGRIARLERGSELHGLGIQSNFH